MLDGCMKVEIALTIFLATCSGSLKLLHSLESVTNVTKVPRDYRLNVQKEIDVPITLYTAIFFFFLTQDGRRNQFDNVFDFDLQTEALLKRH